MGIALSGLVGCAEPSGPETSNHSRRLLVAGTERGALVVDLDWRGVVDRVGPEFVSSGPASFDPRGTLTTVGRLANDDQVMLGIDVPTGTELWRVLIAKGTQPVILDGVQLGASQIAPAPSGSEVYLWRALRNGVSGIAAIDVARQRVTRFLGPVAGRYRGMAATAATAANARGCLVVGVDTGTFATSRGVLQSVCGDSYEARTEVDIPPPSRFVVQVEATPDGRDVIVMTDLEILRYDGASMALEARAGRPLAAPFFLARESGGLIVPDVGSSVVASSGIIYLLDASLELEGVIDLRVLPLGERPLGILGAEESPDGKWLYVLGGIPRDGPLYGPEESHVLVIDRSTGKVADVVRLGTYGGGRPYLMK